MFDHVIWELLLHINAVSKPQNPHAKPLVNVFCLEMSKMGMVAQEAMFLAVFRIVSTNKPCPPHTSQTRLQQQNTHGKTRLNPANLYLFPTSHSKLHTKFR